MMLGSKYWSKPANKTKRNTGGQRRRWSFQTHPSVHIFHLISDVFDGFFVAFMNEINE